MFTRKLVNRLTMPTKNVLICEDDIEQQRNLLGVFQRLFGHQGHVQVCVVPGGEFAKDILETCEADVVLIDHDMPYGDGVETLLETKEIREWYRDLQPKVITASGIPANNDRLMAAGAHYKFTKQQIINGEADDLLRELLKSPSS